MFSNQKKRLLLKEIRHSKLLNLAKQEREENKRDNSPFDNIRKKGIESTRKRTASPSHQELIDNLPGDALSLLKDDDEDNLATAVPKSIASNLSINRILAGTKIK
jgi:hypothetical protein